MDSMESHAPELFERVTTWIGSPSSFILHTIAFIASFAVSVFGFASWQTVLLVVTTIVSLEAIYLSIFIQMTVNRHAHELAGVSEDIEEISEDVEDLHKDVEEISEDVEEIQEDIEEINEDETEEQQNERQAVTLETMAKDIQRLITDLEQLKKGQ